MADQPIETSLALIEQSLEFIKKDVKQIKDELDGKYVTQNQFEPVKKVVYGLVSLTLISVVGAILALALK